jgi:DNA transformation protein
MAEAKEFATHIVDLLDPFGPCESKRMFGGFGIFHQGLMIALIADGSLYLKADDQSLGLFEAEGSDAFCYYKKDRKFKLSYYQATEDFFEQREATVRWASLAYDAALRSAAKKNPRKNRKTKPASNNPENNNRV